MKPSPIKLSSPATQEFWEIPVLYEDEHLLAIDKPARLLSSPDRYDPERPNLMQLLHAGIAARKPWAADRGLTYLANAHRLDFETSGVLLLAKTKPVLVALADLFGTDKPLKRYLALVQGEPPRDQFEETGSLSPHPRRPGLMRIDPRNGKRARTAFKVLERYRGYTLLQCRPYTGRTHQIRVHLQRQRLPICGDSNYGGVTLRLSKIKKNYRLKEGHEERPLVQSLALHAEELTLTHPVTGARVEIKAPWPKDLTVAVKYLRRYALQAPATEAGDIEAGSTESLPTGRIVPMVDGRTSR